ncbi:MarR family winged helix-turn-helix transcriptional regulator [Nocardioides terrisoli]|uniref:MarR family winged helix-turn-helix transcriptional regulator n=1 Tax=Nocardioides terrisoli TaxID=3388267 RepID=UPI00287B9E16|nr:MarR family transcriptional regulator [Nocardioides marmorisolisilvae]
MEHGSTVRNENPGKSVERPDPGDPNWDVVDQIIEDMHRITPEADLSSLHVVSRMLRVIRIFERCREKALKTHGLEAWSFDMLAAIRRSTAEQMRPGDLLEFTFVTSGTMTSRLDSLERRKLIARRRDESDRRGVLVVITDTGRARIDQAFDDIIACQQELIADLDPAESLQLERLLRRMLRSDHLYAES